MPSNETQCTEWAILFITYTHIKANNFEKLSTKCWQYLSLSHETICGFCKLLHPPDLYTDYYFDYQFLSVIEKIKLSKPVSLSLPPHLLVKMDIPTLVRQRLACTCIRTHRIGSLAVKSATAHWSLLLSSEAL